MRMDYEKRIESLRGYMVRESLDGVFIIQSSDMQYLTGVLRPLHNTTDDNKHGDELYGVFITPDRGPFFVVPRMGASRYVEQQIRSLPWAGAMRIIQESEDPGQVLKEVLQQLGNPQRIGVSGRLWARGMFRFRDADPDLELVDISPAMSAFRVVKDEQEIALMKTAGAMTDAVFGAVLKSMRLGMTEYDLVREIAHQVALHGGTGLSFHTGIAIRGKDKPRRFINQGAVAHTPLQAGTVVSFDFGLVVGGYVSDFGRTVFCGDPPAEWIHYHDLVMAAQKKAMEGMISGRVTAAELNRIGRSLIEEAGCGEYFTHRLGHGIGIDVHEAPFLFERDHTVLETGMCFTVEPSIVVPDEAGIRVEDVVMVTPRGGESFSHFTRDLLVI